MIKSTILMAMLILCSLSIWAQTFSTVYGKIGKEEIELNQWSADPDAEAVVLFDIGKSHFTEENNELCLIYERSTRIKILTEAGIDWATIEIPYYQEGNNAEKILEIEAYSYNIIDGNTYRTKLDVNNAFTEKINQYWNLKKFALPNVKAGSIIEYQYKISSKYFFNLRDWKFQWEIPVVYSQYEVRMIPFYEYELILQGAPKFDSQTSVIDKEERELFLTKFNDYIHTYTMTDVPAFKGEEYITSINDYIIKVEFQLSKVKSKSGSVVNVMTTWDKAIKDLLKHEDFGKDIKKSEKYLSEIMTDEEIKTKSQQEKFNLILDYIKANISWDGNYGKMASKSAGKLMSEKRGNTADINLLAIGLLKAAGIEADPLLISTRDHGKIKSDYPFMHFFNNVIILVTIDGKRIFSDGTQPNCLNNRIPTQCINDNGLVIKKDQVEWLGLECLFPSIDQREFLIELNAENELTSSITQSATEYEALNYRNKYADDHEIIKKALNTPDFSIIDSTIMTQNQTKKERPYILHYTTVGKPTKINDKIYISPFLNQTITANPLKQSTRSYPIDMIYPTKSLFRSTIIIPEGYEVEFLPAESKLSNQGFDFNYNATVEQNEIIITFDYNFKISIYPPEYYAKIKYYFNEIVKKGNERIVLKKKQE